MARRYECILGEGAHDVPRPRSIPHPNCARIASSRIATMLVILIIGFTAGPAVSL